MHQQETLQSLAKSALWHTLEHDAVAHMCGPHETKLSKLVQQVAGMGMIHIRPTRPVSDRSRAVRADNLVKETPARIPN